MNLIISKSKAFVGDIVDSINGRIIDVVSAIFYLILIYFSYEVIKIILKVGQSDIPVINNPYSSVLYAFLIITPIAIYHLSFAGDYLKKPSRRVQLFVLSVTLTSIFSIGYVLQIVNLGFVGWLNNITNLEVIPPELLRGNIRLISFLFPLGMIIPIASLLIQMVSDKKLRKDIREQEIEILLPTVFKMDETTVDIKICEDIETGENCIVPEKKTYEHTFLQGGTGSGKTATYIKPVIQQLFEKKAYLREKKKELAFKCLEEGIAKLNKPVNNYYLNYNFSMDLISPVEGKEEEFKNTFDKYILGVRDKEKLIDTYKTFGKIITLDKLSGDSYYQVILEINDGSQKIYGKEFKINADDITKKIKLIDKFKDISIILEDEIRSTKSTNNQPLVEERKESYKIILPELNNNCQYDLKIYEKGSGKIIYKNLGLCVVAPDGGLPSDTIEIAKKQGIKVHKIDPTISEIRNGKIAKFNPLKDGRPDKTGDIIASILVSMDNAGGSNKANAYFTNASVRAVRNLVILLKVTYPIRHKENPIKYKFKDPTLRDILDCLNDFSKVVELVEILENNIELKNKWGSVINYFKTNFYSPDDAKVEGNVVNAEIGSQRKKTENSISGIINQLDNFVTREEVSYILCDREESLNLNEIIENGECIAIASRQNELGERLGKAFALFFILSIQNTVLSRYSEDENPEIPYHLIIDEFPFYINDNTKVFFTFARKYHCAVTVAIQNMAQLREISDVFKETIFTNTDTKILLPKSNVEDRKYWSEYFGTHQSFEMMTGINSSSIFADNPRYSEQRRGTLQDINNVSEQEIHDLHFKEALYSYTDKKGRSRVGKGITEFMKEAKEVKIKEYNFEQFNKFEKQNKKDEKKENYDKESDEVIDLDSYKSEKTDSKSYEQHLEQLTKEEIDSIELADNNNKQNQQQEVDKNSKNKKENNKKEIKKAKIVEREKINNINIEDIDLDLKGD